MAVITRRRVVFAVTLGTLALLLGFAIIRIGRMAAGNLQVVVGDAPPGKSSGTFVMRVPRSQVDGAAADAAPDESPAGQLVTAAGAGDMTRLEQLLAEGVSVDAASRGYTALTQAALFGHADAVSRLLDAGADPNAHAEPDHQTPLAALLFGWQLGRSENPMGIEAREEERLMAARTLVAAGADPRLAPTGVFSAAMLANALGVEELQTLFAEAE